MPITDVDIVSSCAECGTEIERVSVKKDNMMLFTNELLRCPSCNADRLQVRDVADRLDSIEKEQQSYPKPLPAEPFPGQGSSS